MRLVQVTIPTGKRDAVTRALDDEGVEYVLTDETSGRKYTAVAYIPLPTNAVEPILERLRQAGLSDQAYTVIIDAQTVVSRDFEQLQERYAEEETEDRIAREELIASAKELLPSMRIYVIMTIVSGVIATAGLLLNSSAVIVGSMVIAPLIGPAMAASVGTVVVDDRMFAEGVKLQAIGLVLSVASAAALGFLVQLVNLIPPVTDVTTIPEIQKRLYPDFLSLVVALGAGVAGSLSLTAGVSSALVGVMIAVALIPPAATIGIGLAWGQPVVSLGATVLTLVNLLSINLAALVVLWYTGYRPTNWFQIEEARGETLRRIVILVAAIVALSAFLGGVTYDSFRTATTEENIRTAVDDALANDTNATLLEVEVQVERGENFLFRNTERVVVTVGVDSRDHQEYGARIDRRIEEVVNREVRTEVRYVLLEST